MGIDKEKAKELTGIIKGLKVKVQTQIEGEGMIKIDCSKCREQNSCCSFGAWVDLEEAKKILSLGLKGDFYHFEEDSDFPSGYKVGTSCEDEPCSFITPEGLCAIHKVDYNLKPAHCKEFPYDNGKLAPNAELLCPAVKSKRKIKALPAKPRDIKGL